MQHWLRKQVHKRAQNLSEMLKQENTRLQAQVEFLTEEWQAEKRMRQKAEIREQECVDEVCKLKSDLRFMIELVQGSDSE